MPKVGSDPEMNRSVLDILSPCIGICRLDRDTRFCLGCFRTAREVAEWTTADNRRRLQILAELKLRRRAAGRTSAADSRPRRRRSQGGGINI